MNIINFNSIRGLESIDICLENCDVISVPLDNITGSIDYTPGGCSTNHLFMHIVDSGEINIHSCYSKTSPCQRLDVYNDIVAIDLMFEDGSSERVDVPWFSEDSCTNKYQTSTLSSYKEIEISIDVRNHTIDIYEALVLEDETVLERKSNRERIIVKSLDENDKVFINYETGELLSLSRSLLTEQFILIDTPSY